YQPLKVTAVLMILASIALAGIYPFSGFFSKDKILEAAFGSGVYWLWGALMLGAFLTAFYSFRLIMLVFFGIKKHQENPHEAYPYMLYAMIPLGVLAVFSGFFEGKLHHFVLKTLPDFEHSLSHQIVWILILVTSFVALLGIVFAIFQYSKGGFSTCWEKTFIYKLLFNQYYIPNLYHRIFIQGFIEVSKIAWRIDKRIIDCIVDSIALCLKGSGLKLSFMQSGNLSKMLRIMFFGLLILLACIFIWEDLWIIF
ncbi:MAG: NADH-quinone oxidoreductase subunit L, partial [Helicobacter sp.]|nr:NADH-quinone oxidoreductase subunit L [Helicobacter sp.]